MTSVSTPAAETAHGDHGAGHGHGPVAGEMRFEPSEVIALHEDDRGAGEAIGKLLALIFCVLLVLMSSVTWWTSWNEATKDPYVSGTPAKHAGDHH